MNLCHGATITLQSYEYRKSHDLSKPSPPPVVTRVQVAITRWYPEHNLLMGEELSRFCYVEGYPDLGRNIGARNPYEAHGSGWRNNCFLPGGSNSYLIEPGNWRHVPYR